jgi:transmembrane sensor
MSTRPTAETGTVSAVIWLAKRFHNMKRESDPIDPAEPGQPEALPRAEREAIQWVVRMTSGEAGEADRAALAQWRQADPDNEAALAMARRLWFDVGQALPARAVAARARPALRRQWQPLALAASMLAAVALGYLAVHVWRGDLAGRGMVAVDVDGAEGRCRLMLGSGEAAFDLTPDLSSDQSSGPARPAGAARETVVRMLGTAFSIRPEAAGVLVTVTGGRVQVKVGNVAREFTVGQQLRCRAGRQPSAGQADAGAGLLVFDPGLPPGRDV